MKLKTSIPALFLLMLGGTAPALAQPAANVAFPEDSIRGEAAAPRETVREIFRLLLDFRSETPLTEEQKSQLRAVVAGEAGSIREMLREAREARSALEAAVRTYGVESWQASAAAQRIGRVAADRALLAAGLLTEAGRVLTPEQKERIAEMREIARLAIDGMLDAPRG